jgi:hypothetical protein
MSKKNEYYCSLSLGNMSIAETEMLKESLESFLKSFYCKDYEIEKVMCSNDDYYYVAKIQFSDFSKIKVQRFMESLISFSLYWKMSIFEETLFD